MRFATAFALVAALCLASASAGTPGQDAIKNVVVLMLENRSFDHMLGRLNALNPDIDGLHGNESCPLNPAMPSAGSITVNSTAPYVIFSPDHSVPAITVQVSGMASAENTVKVATMDGFVLAAANIATDSQHLVMDGYTPERVPAISTLATEFAVSDQWHASIPGPTEVNRMYALSATSDGASTNDKVQLAEGYPQRTFLNNLEDAGLDWGVFYSDFPTAFFLRETRDRLDNFHFLTTFYEKAAEGSLPAFSWVEPRYFYLPDMPSSDQHPAHNVLEGETLIADVYKAVRNSPQWNNTLFIVTYDEHGGFYDHVPTPLDGVPNPDGKNATSPPFNFDRLGVRIPTVLASPWIPKGLVVHNGTKPTPTSAFDHTSILATVKKLWGLPNFLTKRDAWASTFENIFTLDAPRTDCPTELPRPADPLPYEMIEASRRPINELQADFLEIMARMNGLETYPETLKSEADGGHWIIDQVEKYFRRTLGYVPQ